MINLAKNLGTVVIAEGVDDALQKEWLDKAGCDQMQGLFVSPSCSFDEVVPMLQRNYQIA